MAKLRTAFILSISYLMSTQLTYGFPKKVEENPSHLSGIKAKTDHLILLAKRKKKRKVRKKHLTSEARNQKGQTQINFDEASIDGRRRLPAGVAITKNRLNHDYDLINLRLRWHPEMIQSTSNLETGQGR